MILIYIIQNITYACTKRFESIITYMRIIYFLNTKNAHAQCTSGNATYEIGRIVVLSDNFILKQLRVGIPAEKGTDVSNNWSVFFRRAQMLRLHA